MDFYGYGLRVPAILTCPYAKAGTVDHTRYDFTSVLRTIENHFGLQPLSFRDRDANGLGGGLDLAQQPLAPVRDTNILSV